MIKSWFLILVSIIAVQCVTAQTEKYWVFFTDKNHTEFNPYEYFDQKAIDRRIKLGINLNDSTDFPVNENYLSQVSLEATEMSRHSRWFNCVAVIATETEIENIHALPFVCKVQAFPKGSMMEAIASPEGDYLYGRDRALIEAQTQRMGKRDFQRANINGSGIRVAVLDAGFKDADHNAAFDHLRKGNKILATYDFVKNKENVYHSNTHGTSVLSCIAGIYTSNEIVRTDTVGLATGAEFLLARTEKGLWEMFSEEENWLSAVEWADKNGADIINSSLGYTGQRYTYEDMNGTATLVSKAGNLAAKKGILVVNSAGNDGSSDWKFVGAPADADSVLSVGGLMPWTGLQTSFSSIGPTFDYRFKPNVTAYGQVIAAKGDYMSETQGTSFSSPLVAGFAACAWQANPDLTNMELFKKLEQGSDLYPYFDYAHGYGVPMAENFIQEKESVDTTFTVQKVDHYYLVELTDTTKTDRVELTQLELMFNDGENAEMDQAVLSYPDYLFYHFENELGRLTSYTVFDMSVVKSLEISCPQSAHVLRIYFEGFTQEIKLK